MTSSARTSAFAGAVLTVGMRWTDRVIGLVSTMVLARLLLPEDFGLVAMAMIVVGSVDVLLDLGVGAALIQNRHADRSDFDTAWTLRFCQAALVAAIIAIGAPLAARYYGDPRVVDILRVIAISVVIGGFENIGTVHFQKDMEFGRDFRFFVAKRLLTTAVTLTLAFGLQSYWALVLGSLTGRGFGVALSYFMHPFRPRVSFSRMRRIWSFSQWNLVSNAANYLTNRLDQFVVGKRANPSVLGAYAIGDEISAMPTTEILAPLGRVMFPAFVNARVEPNEFRRIVILSFGVQALIGVPAGAGIALVAPEFVPIFLGEKWRVAVPFVQVLGFVGVITALAHSSHYALLALGRMRALSAFAVLRLATLFTALVVMFPGADAEQVAEIRLSVALLALVALQVMMARIVPALNPRTLLMSVWRALLAAGLMVLAVLWVSSVLAEAETGLLLLAKVLAGIATYVTTVAVLWQMSGRPAGPEAYILSNITRIAWPPGDIRI